MCKLCLEGVDETQRDNVASLPKVVRDSLIDIVEYPRARDNRFGNHALLRPKTPAWRLAK